MLRIKEAIVVEGRYDKNTLSQLVDALIIPTDGFGIFRDKEKAELLRQLARTRGLILLTDSDGAGFVIRNHLKGILPPEQLKQAYIPDCFGKERRKRKPGKEGKLGVEGMSPQVLEAALRQAGATILDENAPQEPSGRSITKADFFRDGLTGTPDSSRRRDALKSKLGLPQRLTANGLLEVLNQLYDYDTYRKAVSELEQEFTAK
ncbi:MAG: toprim domain-containing protein [Candidatus Onthomonas sp.]